MNGAILQDLNHISRVATRNLWSAPANSAFWNFLQFWTSLQQLLWNNVAILSLRLRKVMEHWGAIISCWSRTVRTNMTLSHLCQYQWLYWNHPERPRYPHLPLNLSYSRYITSLTGTCREYIWQTDDVVNTDFASDLAEKVTRQFPSGNSIP